MERPFQKYLPDYIFLLAISLSILALDQVTKWIVRTRLDFGSVWVPFSEFAQYFRIVHWQNTGAAFGIFQNGGFIFTILAILVTIAILNFYPAIPRQDRFLRVALAFQLGGALGNLIDRLSNGWVTDFISVGNLPVFNVADASISIGVAIILIPLLPRLPQEWSHSTLRKQARTMNGRHRKMPETVSDFGDEPISLGAIGVFFSGSEWVKKYYLHQKIWKIRRRRSEPGKTSSGLWG